MAKFRLVSLAVLLTICGLRAGWAAEPFLLSEIGSERATSGAGGKIITYEGKTHVVWQDSPVAGQYLNQVRTLDHLTGQWSETVTLGSGVDNHARPVITIDHDGYLHAVLSGHSSAVTYRRSVLPNDASEWTTPESAGSGTYPVLATGPDNTLYLSLRDGWKGMDLYVKPPGESWSKRSKLVERAPEYAGLYAAYLSRWAWGPDDTLHVVVDFYEGRGIHQAVAYMQSPDGGQTWQRANGTPVALPARPEDMDILARDTDATRPPGTLVLLSQGSIAVNSEGTPHVLFVSHLDEPGALTLAKTNEQGEWSDQPIDTLEQAYPQKRPVYPRGSFSITEDDQLYAFLQLFPLGDDGWTADGKPKRGISGGPEGLLARLDLGDGSGTFASEAALDEGTIFNEVSVEWPTGVNTVAAGTRPSYVYFDGLVTGSGEVIQNNVYFVHGESVVLSGPTPTSMWNEDTGDFLWGTAGNWDPSGVPNSNSSIVGFGDVISVPRTVTNNAAVTVNGMEFGEIDVNSSITPSYTLAGTGSVTLDGNASSPSPTPSIFVVEGSHEITVDVNLNVDAGVAVAADSSLTLNDMNLNSNTLTVASAGTVNLNGTVNTGGGSVVVTGGVLGGTGTVSGNLTNSGGTVGPGLSPGTLNVTGDYNQTAGSLLIEIDGLAAGTEHDVLNVTGDLTISGGTLDVVVGFATTPGDSFDIFNFSTADLSGATFNLPALDPGLVWVTSALDTTGILSLAVLGDFNGDLVIDLDDYLELQTNFFSTGQTFNETGDVASPAGQGEGFGDGIVDIYDFKHFSEDLFPGGASAFAAALAGAVPEPNTFVLLLAAAPACLLRRSRNRK